MKRVFVATLIALALCLAATPDAEAGCRGGRGLFRGGLRARIADRRANRGWHLFQGRARGGCSTCELETAPNYSEPVEVPSEPVEIRVATADE